MAAGAFFVLHLPDSLHNVYVARKKKGLAFAPLLWEWIPIITFTTACLAWLLSPTSCLLRNNHLVLFAITTSFVFGRMTTQIILAHLTHSPFPYFTEALVPLVIGAVLVHPEIFHM